MEDKFRIYRSNALILLAYLMVAVCLVVTISYSSLDEYAKGTVTLILGRFLGYIDNAYQFEFGTTRNSQKKDETISQLSKDKP